MSKQRNKIAHVDNIKFHSKGEARRYQQLKLLERAGEIKDLELQPKFTLLDKFTTVNGKKIRALTYSADFKYQEKDKTIVEDFKGHETMHFKIKMKLFLNKYPQYVFRLSKASGIITDY